MSFVGIGWGLQFDHRTAEQRPEAGPIAADPIGQVAGQLGDLRLRAQEEASKLRMRILQLESVLRGLGAVIPEADGVSA